MCSSCGATRSWSPWAWMTAKRGSALDSAFGSAFGSALDLVFASTLDLVFASALDLALALASALDSALDSAFDFVLAMTFPFRPESRDPRLAFELLGDLLEGPPAEQANLVPPERGIVPDLDAEAVAPLEIFQEIRILLHQMHGEVRMHP